LPLDHAEHIFCIGIVTNGRPEELQARLNTGRKT
jgi:hypothetical protein